MVHERDELPHAPQWRVKRNLVQVLNDDIVVVRRELVRIIAASEERISLAVPDSVNVDAIQVDTLRSVSPRAAKQIDTVSAGDDATEDFSEVKLRAACLGILVILPVEYEYAH
jgi:hypothetical protein